MPDKGGHKPAPPALTTSLVMTTYNHERYIGEALDSILDQDLRPNEIIVVDDGSMDRTFEIAQRYEKAGVRVVRRKNGGPSQAFNQGAALAAGDILIFFSGDDVLTDGSIRARVETLGSGRFDIVCSIPNWIDGSGCSIADDEHPSPFTNFGSPDPASLFSQLYYTGNSICAPSIAMTRSCWLTVGTLNPGLLQLQDYEYWLRACGFQMRFTCLAQPCLQYRWHGSNLSAEVNQRVLYEGETVWLDVPDQLNRNFLMEVAFGKEFASFKTPLSDDDLRMLVRRRHGSAIVVQHARNQLRETLKDPEGTLRIFKGVF